MTARARLSTVLTTALLPALALAQYGQEAGGAEPSAPSAGYGWLWAIAVAAVIVILAVVMFRRGRRGGPPPPARRTLGV